MDDQTKQILLAAFAGLIRHGLTTGAGILVGLGALQQGQSTNFIDIGSGIALWAIGFGWSYIQKHRMVKGANQ